MRTIITRRKEYVEDKVYFTTKSFYLESSIETILPWSNCLYIHFCKEDFPGLRHPKLVDGWVKSQKRFDYDDCDIADLDWHCGITFYEEVKNLENGKVYVKAGCDFRHYGDDWYQKEDRGEMILKKYSDF